MEKLNHVMYQSINREDELREILEKFIEPKKTAIIGLGNELRCDDAFGVLIVNALLKTLPSSIVDCIKIINASTNPEAYLDVFQSTEKIIIIDTINSHDNNGNNLIVMHLSQESIKNRELLTHLIDIKKFIKKRETLLIGIHPSCLEYEIKVSLEVAKAMSIVIKSIYKTLISRCNLTK